MPAIAQDMRTILENIKEISARFAQERSERQRRRELVRADFDLIRDAGFLLTCVPTQYGGAYESRMRSTRPQSDMLRILAQGDPSVALVASMHLGVIDGMVSWTSIEQAPKPFTKAWDEQRRWVFQTACDGHWWGTIISESGTGGDMAKTKAAARLGATPNTYLLSGQKHFGSGSGITSFVITTGVPEGETQPDVFFMDMRDRPWDGSAGVKLMAAWDGHGMTATQSHAMAFKDMPVTRATWPGNERAKHPARLKRPMGLIFTAVIVGIVETAIETARQQLEPKRDSMRACEQVEWSKVEMEGWLIKQAYEGVLRDVEQGNDASRSGLLCKEAVAKLAESVLSRISKVVGGGAYSRYSPYGFWLEDVRALGFLRPAWGVAYDSVFQGAWHTES
jgi:alkylation response protein AidB-like acyl-CoA dehydrogenase